MARPPRPFSTVGHLPWGGPLNVLVGNAIDRALGLGTLKRLYESSGPFRAETFPADALRTLRIELDVAGTPGSIPRDGAVLVVANHPLGALDGLAMLALLKRVRPDVKVLGNQFLATIPEMRPSLIAVDPFGRRNARAQNLSGLRAALRWLQGGGCLLAFPAGEVAHRTDDGGVALDVAWHPHVASLAVACGAPVVPAFIAGTNGWTFRLAGRVHPLLRTALLPRALLARRDTRAHITVGEPIAAATLSRLPVADRAAYLKTRTYLLRRQLTRRDAEPPSVSPVRTVAPLLAPELLLRDIQALPLDRQLVKDGDLEVYCARAEELPSVLPQIARLRERTFRAAGEGTGQAYDLDRFDPHYWHLFAWDASRSRIVGAYRIGITSEILPVHGAAGLYTNTLFHYDNRLLREIGPAIELGRSFVCRESQREYASLLVLWRGIGAFIARRPACRHVFGAVSISNRYDTLSRQLLVKFLSAVALHPRAARLVRPLRPLRKPVGQQHLLESATVSSIEAVSSLLRAIEPDGKPIPVLLRQYLNLNARLLGFSVDPDFGDALDGLMLADLTTVPRPMLSRVMGREAADRFLAYHRGTEAARADRRAWWRWHLHPSAEAARNSQ